jgi:hypothetical protein
MRFLSLLIVTLLAQAPVRPSSLSGIIVKQESRAPLSRATVLLQMDGTPGRGYSIITSSDGKFSFDDVIPGRYRLAVTRDGYVPAEIATAGPEGCGAPITMEAGIQRTGLSIEMAPAGAIAGRLYDREGEPAANVTVQAIKSTYQNGGRVLTSVQTAQTNDIGEYRLFYLPPGRYLVGAALENRSAMDSADERVTTAAPASAAPPSPPPPPVSPAAPLPPILSGRFVNGLPTPATPGPRIAPIYFPSLSDPKTATPIEVRAGETFQGADMIVSRVELRSIKGNVQNADARETFQRMTVSLISAVAQPNGGAVRSLEVQADGSFEIPSVLPGSYTLLASGTDSSGRLIGRVSVDVFATDVRNVAIGVSRGLSLSGSIRSDETETSNRIFGVVLVPTTEDRSIQNLLDLRSNVANGTFKIDAIPPGNYQAWIMYSAPVPIYVKSVRLGSSDVRNGFRFEAQSNVPLEITVGSNGGVVDGVILSNKGQPVRGATVVLVPDATLRQRTSSFKTTTTDTTGTFRINGIGPGDYKIFSWEAVETGAWEDPDFLRPYEVRGQSLTILEGTRQSIQAIAIPSTGPIYKQCPVSGLR